MRPPPKLSRWERRHPPRPSRYDQPARRHWGWRLCNYSLLLAAPIMLLGTAGLLPPRAVVVLILATLLVSSIGMTAGLRATKRVPLPPVRSILTGKRRPRR